MEHLISNLRDLDNRFKHNLAILENGAAEAIKLEKARKLRSVANSIDQSKVRLLVDPDLRTATAGWKGVQYLADDFFGTPTTIEQLGDIDQHTIFLLTSHLPQKSGLNSLVNFIKFGFTTPAIIVIWDWDNHHHLFISTTLSLASDLYFYSHNANEYEITKFCDYSFHVQAASCQWEQEFLEENIALVVRRDRSNETLGRFVHYGLFESRNRLVERLSQKFRNIQFVDSGPYFQMSALERLDLWTGHKTHFIIPALNDVSTRIFDALVSGGVVILPQRYATKRFFEMLNENDYELYDEYDLLEPERLADRANTKFDREGVSGALRRATEALKKDTGIGRLAEIREKLWDTIEAIKLKSNPGF
jgi:hypothetical protein